MRLPAFKVYRAFPELDRFSDEQCEGFVAAANRSGSGRAWRRVTQAAFAVLLMSMGAGAY